MSWNYRVGYRNNPVGFVEYGVVEAYYEGGKIVGVTDFTSPYSEDAEGLKWSLEKMLEAFDKEVLDLSAIEGDS